MSPIYLSAHLRIPEYKCLLSPLVKKPTNSSSKPAAVAAAAVAAVLAAAAALAAVFAAALWRCPWVGAPPGFAVSPHCSLQLAS